MNGDTVQLLIFGPPVLLWAILDVRHNRRKRASVDAALAAMEPNAAHVTGGAEVHGSRAPSPFARLSFDRSTMVLSPRSIFVPVRSVVIGRDEVSRIQCREAFPWRLHVRVMNQANKTAGWFRVRRGSRLLDALASRGWPLVWTTGLGWKEEPTRKVG